MPQSIVVSIQENLAYFGELLNAGDAKYKQVDREHENLRLAIQDGLRFTEAIEATANLAIDAFEFVETYAYWYQWLVLLQQVSLACHDKLPVLECKILMCLGQAQFQQGFADKSLQTLRKAEAVAETLSDEELVANILVRLGVSYLCIMHHQKAKMYAIRVLEVSSEEWYPDLWLSAKNLCGIIALEQCSFTQAGELFEQIAAFTKINNLRNFQILALGNWSKALIELKAFDEAEEKINQASKLILEGERSYYYLFLILCKAELYYTRGQLQWAYATLQGISIPDLVNSKREGIQAEVEYLRARILVDQGEIVSAENSIDIAKYIWRYHGENSKYARAIGVWSEIKYKQNAPMAFHYVVQALDLLAPYVETHIAKRIVIRLEELVSYQ